MGSALSAPKPSKLVKPEDCSQEVWKKILQLFDKLDTDGTHSIDDEELMGHIATLHVTNNIAKLNEDKRTLNNNFEFEKEKINSNLEITIKKLQKETAENITALEQLNSQKIDNIDSSIEKINKMSPEERAVKIRNTICGNKSSIEFWDFYKYMKTRSRDIPNIVW